MTFVVGILFAIIIILIIYLMYVQAQIRSMSRQLDKRLREHTRQPVSLELVNMDLSRLAARINQCLKAEENLRLAGIREEKKFKEMIADISHDLRTPLTSIMGYQQLIEAGELSGEQRNQLQIAEKHARELGQLIDHFFEYSYLLNSEPEIHVERMNLTNLLAECLVASVTTLESHNLTVHFDDENPPIFISADKEMVTRIIENLIRNCIQHSNGDITVRLIKDHGTVISFCNPVKNPSDIDADKIFDRFYTGDTARSHSTGLGLSIVKLLAEQMCGSVSACIKGSELDIRVILPD